MHPPHPLPHPLTAPSSVEAQAAEGLRCHGPDLRLWPLEQRVAALQMLLHCADISNPARPLAHCVIWGEKIAEELFGQGEWRVWAAGVNYYVLYIIIYSLFIFMYCIL
jgi:hypothetical protein